MRDRLIVREVTKNIKLHEAQADITGSRYNLVGFLLLPLKSLGQLDCEIALSAEKKKHGRFIQVFLRSYVM